MPAPSVNAQRLWNAHMRMAEIGATPDQPARGAQVLPDPVPDLAGSGN